MVSYKDITIQKPTTSKSFDDVPNKLNQIVVNDSSLSIRRRTRREPFTLDALREIFIDANMDEFMNLHESLVDKYSMFGFMNKSTSSKFIHDIVDSIVINNSVMLTDVQSNYILSDDEDK